MLLVLAAFLPQPAAAGLFSDIPSAIDIPVQGDQEDEAVEIDLEDLLDDPTELCTLFENEHAAKTYWMTVALAYAKQAPNIPEWDSVRQFIQEQLDLMCIGKVSVKEGTTRAAQQVTEGLKASD